MQRVFVQIVAFVTCAVQFLCNFVGLVPAGKSSLQTDLDTLFSPIKMASTVYILDPRSYTEDEQAMLAFLQGIAAQDEASIFFEEYESHRQVLERFRQAHPEIGFVTSVVDPWELVDLFKDKFDGRFVTFGAAEKGDPTIIMASNLASTQGYLGVPASLREQALAHGLTQVRDLREIKGSFAEKQQVILNECYDQFRTRRILMHINANDFWGRDVGIAQGALFFFTREAVSDFAHCFEERALRDSVFAWADPAARLLGFWEDGDETLFINAVSVAGKSVSPVHELQNSSFLLAMGDCGPLVQPGTPEPSPSNDKHTICFYVTDGDNLGAVIKKGGVCAQYPHMMGPRSASGDDFPIAYTNNPLIGYLQPAAAAYFYDNDDPLGLGAHDSYIAGLSGLGACHTFQLPKKNLRDHAKMSAQAMEKTDMHVFTTEEEYLFNPFWWLYPKRVIDEFAKYDTIHGAFIQLNPHHYSGGLGCVVWSSNGKPWIGVRTVLWSPDGDRDSVTQEWLDGFVDSINRRSANTSCIGGYSVIAIHPWSITYASLQYIVSKLDPSRVQIVSPDTLVQMVTENVPHKNALPPLVKAY